MRTLFLQTFLAESVRLCWEMGRWLAGVRIEPFILMPDAVSDHSAVFIRAGYKIVLEQTLGKIGRRV